MQAEPLVSVIVLNWNGKHFLEKCLPSLLTSDHRNLEIIVLDCASKDGSAEYVRTVFPQVNLIAFSQDPGADAANNQGIARSTGEYVMLLNNDTTLRPDTISILLEELRQDKNAAISPTELDWNQKFVRKGYTYGWIAPLYLLIKPLLKADWLARAEPFYLGTSCVLVPREIISAVPLNEHLIMLVDLEWSWRLRLGRVRLKVSDRAYFQHYVAGTLRATAKAAYYSTRVTIATHLICQKALTFMVFLPMLLLYFAIQGTIFALNRRFDCLKAMARGFASVLRDRRTFLADRGRVQRSRQVGDWEIMKAMILSCYHHYKRASGRVSFFGYVKKLFRGSI